MTQQIHYLTPEGEAKLKAELKELTGSRREELAQRLRSAIQMGDLSENADYHKAKEDQAFLEDFYRDGGVSADVLAASLEVTERTVRRRDDRIMEKLVERLGGEPPWKR